jgi:hypothetical protein
MRDSTTHLASVTWTVCRLPRIGALVSLPALAAAFRKRPDAGLHHPFGISHMDRMPVAEDKEFPSGAFLEALPKSRGAFDALPVSRLTGVCSGQKQ